MQPTFNHHFLNGKLQDNWLQLVIDIYLTSLIYNLSNFNMEYATWYLLYHQIWCSQVILSSRYALNPALESLIQLLQLILIGIVGKYTREKENQLLVTLVFIAYKLALFIPYTYVISYYPSKNIKSILPLLTALVLEIGLWIAALYTDYYILLWLIGISIEKLGTIYAICLDIPTYIAYFNDRFCVFTITLLGMALFNQITGYPSDSSFTLVKLAHTLLYTILTFSFWHNYFYCTKFEEVEHKFIWRAVWIITQLLLHFFISLLGNDPLLTVASIGGILVFTSILNSLDRVTEKRFLLVARLVAAIITITLGITIQEELYKLLSITVVFVVLMIIEHLLFTQKLAYTR